LDQVLDQTQIQFERITAGPNTWLWLFLQPCYHSREVLPASGGVGVVGTEACFTDRQGTLIQGAGAVRVALVAQDEGEVAEDAGGVRVVGAQAGLEDR
jgi:hypothetical protein